MGTYGLVGPIMGYQEMTNAEISPWVAILEILVMYILLPAALSLGISEGMRKFGWIKAGDMKLDS